jgi:hypothetical protein
MLGQMSGASMMGLGMGLLAGVAAGLLFAPSRGSQLRATLRSRADGAWDRGMMLLEEGRRAFRTGGSEISAAGTTGSAGTATLTASLGEIAQMHSGTGPLDLGARS